MTWFGNVWKWTEEDEVRHQQKIKEAEAYAINNLDCPDSYQLRGMDEEKEGDK